MQDSAIGTPMLSGHSLFVKLMARSEAQNQSEDSVRVLRYNFENESHSLDLNLDCE